MLRPLLTAFLLVFAASAALAAPASAADVSFTGGGLTITGAPGEGSRLTVQADINSRATVHDDADGLRPGPGCIGTPRQVVCEYLLAQQCYPCAATIDLGDASDTLILAGTSVKGPFLVDAGAGDDVVQIRGEANAIVRGGPGNDTLRADGLSELDGGDGADVLQGDHASASYASRTSPVTVTLDGVANDGVLGEHDNAATGSVIGGEGADALTGNAAANDISGRDGADFLAGGEGNDTLRADGGGIDRVEAGAGDDRVEGATGSDVQCGAGNDLATGLRVPGAYGDCETVFETRAELPYLTVSGVTVVKRRPRVAVGWHEPLIGLGPAVTASGIAEMRYRGRIIARGRFTALVQPEPRTIGLPLTARGRALACRSAHNVRLLVVATAQGPLSASRGAIRRGARLPRIGRCAQQTGKRR